MFLFSFLSVIFFNFSFFNFSPFRSFDNAAEEFGCEVHGFDPTGLLWRQGMHGKDYSGIDYAVVRTSPLII
jgi:hypothetical protein